MNRTLLLAALAAASLTVTAARAAPDAAPPAPTPVATDATTPSAGDLLFERPQMKNTAPGSTITYDYLRRSGIVRGPYGPPISDEIKFTIEPGKSAESRDVRVQMFSGGNRIPAGPFVDMPGNPVLSLFLENHLKGLAGLLEANPRYLKNAIRKGMREKATITKTEVEFKGRKVEGWRIEMQPFVGDPLTDRMRGFDNLTYTFVTSPDVPGEIVSIQARATKPDGGELLEERLDYDQKDS
ncbi:hypothetical protein [Methylorubrum suomiense]|uniref:DUF1571 domain-containing protein n=1 Tax=Methylorubrum suomiense TaxID=144191 RepID=A0ABQ4UYP6_9HYPH|nr:MULTISPECIES: hypothetical protein [Methylobacteriaceae]GJE77456.1 hypothetical protein BGCPKDLD_4061 [Methylorubrum suomiense]